MSELEVIQVIVTTLTLRGKGKEGDPYRRITQYWDMKGNLLFEKDPCDKEYLVETVAQVTNL